MNDLSRRTFLLGAGLAATAPLLSPGTASATADPDQLFRDGWFAAADRGYARVLHADPTNVRAVAQRGYIALLNNRFRDAERFLSQAIGLAPDDVASRQRLAECFVRQDQHARAVPLLRATGRPRDTAYAELYSHLSGIPWQVHGAPGTRVPFLAVDPVPSVKASLNGGPPRGFLLDTYSTLDLAADVADEIGLRSIATISGVVGGIPVPIHLGILGSIRIGDIELRNIPMQWVDHERPPLPDGSPPAGALGTTTFYHLLTTMDYAGQALVLRRKTSGFRTAGDRLPLWLAGDHFPCSMGSMRDFGPRVVTLDTGGIGHGFDTTVEMAERAGIAVDYDNPTDFGGTRIYPTFPDRISLGRAVGHDVRGIAIEGDGIGIPGPAQATQFGFTPITNLSHEFYKPFAITFDYTDMHVYIR